MLAGYGLHLMLAGSPEQPVALHRERQRAGSRPYPSCADWMVRIRLAVQSDASPVTVTLSWWYVRS
jgi:hypothetical protein